MKAIRLFGASALAALLAALPGVSYATSYRHFSSRALHFAIDYPSTWSIRYNSAKAYETFEQRNSEGMTVNYIPAHGSVKSFTGRLASAFHGNGMTVTAPVVTGNRGHFTARGMLGGVTMTLEVVTIVTSHAEYSLSAAAAPGHLSTAQSIFAHMVASFTSM